MPASRLASEPSAPTWAARLRRAVIAGVTLGLTVLAGPVPQAHAAETVWDRVAVCESGARWDINTGNGYFGGLQLSDATWRAYGGQWYAARADQASKSQQIAIARRVLAVQGPGAWPTCGARAGLTITSGLSVQVSPEAPNATAVRPSILSSVLPLTVDGKYGMNSKRATEVLTGGTIDGYQTRNDIKLLQVHVGSYPDGVIGPKTTAALQRMVGAHPDGKWGPLTTRALQSYLNKALG